MGYFSASKAFIQRGLGFVLVKDVMNFKYPLPLGVNSRRFIVAVGASDDKEHLRWAQLRPIGFSIRNSNQLNSLPGSGSIEKEIDEDIWNDFESDLIDIPNGFASLLPWTKEYKNASEASRKRRERRLFLQEQADLATKLDKNQLWELASVYVFP